MPRATEHPHIETILRYFDGCNKADVAVMKSAFAEDVVHYFVDHEPVRGAEGLAGYWAKVGPKTRARWYVDHAIVHRDEAVIEWSMSWVPPGREQRELLRGTEWYAFRDGKIAEIRSYHCNYHLRDPANYQLRAFPYAERDYSLPGHAD